MGSDLAIMLFSTSVIVLIYSQMRSGSIAVCEADGVDEDAGGMSRILVRNRIHRR